MSRRCERKASYGRGRYYPGLWEDNLLTWKARPDLFHYGCGQSTMQRGVREVTGRFWPSHHIRRQLNYAVNAGFVRRMKEGEYVDERRPHTVSRFKLIKTGPLAKPMEALVQNVSDIVESNGKTIRENNLEKTHQIPLGTLVEIKVTEDTEYCFGKYKGARLFVVSHERDCDGEKLYGLSGNRDLFVGVDKRTDSVERRLTRMNLIDGITEESLQVVKDTPEDWLPTPPIGSYVVASHPLTVMNPYLIFRVAEIHSSGEKIWVRGKETCWFSVKSVRPPTEAEKANLNNYNPEEL